MNIRVASYFEVPIECSLIDNKSDTLVVLLPGIGYTCDRPLLDYSKKLAIEMNYDVLPIEYGFQIARKKLNHSDEFNIVVRESREILLKSLNERYKRIVLIGKSIGTLIQSAIAEKIANYEIYNIYLTPVNETVKVGIKENSLVIAGNDDPMINEDTLSLLRNMSNIRFLEIDKADHSLNIKYDVFESINILKDVIMNEREYLLSLKTKI